LAEPSQIQMFRTWVSPQAVKEVTDVLRSGWLNEGAVVKRFEERLASDLGLVRPVALNSGTSALHLALCLTGVEAGDEVILPAQTFVATGAAILMAKAVPVFADIDPNSGNVTAATIAERMTPRTRAAIVVHWGGLPCDMPSINDALAARGATTIEDAAHALGARQQGRPVGALSRFTAFSFQTIKHLTTGDGGALCCANASDEQEARALRWFGIDRAQSRPNELGARMWDIKTLGFKYHMNNVAAAIGVGNLADFPLHLARRREIAAIYRGAFAGVPGLQLLDLPSGLDHAYWLFTMRVQRRSAFVTKLSTLGIQASVVDLGIDRNSLFAPFRRALPGQRLFDEEQISIPVHEGLAPPDVDRVIDAVRSGW
jgi:perosamine synthetase